jgi:hypothetical protein
VADLDGIKIAFVVERGGDGREDAVESNHE